MFSKLNQSVFCLTFLLVTVFTNAQVSPTRADDRLNSMKLRESLEKASPLNAIKFKNIGPSVMSGRVVDIDVNPNDPTEFYVAYATGGLWYTHNNGQSFAPLFDSAEVITIGDIAINWKTGTIWVGTGEVNSSRSSYAGIGIYKSIDHGKNWAYLGLPESHHIGKILLNPADDNTAWVAALGHLYSPNKERGVYKTTDGGKTWKQTLYIDENTGAVDIDMNPQNPSELYAAAWYRTRTAWNFEESGKTSGIYNSMDGGNTWTLVSGKNSGFPTGEGVGRIGIAVYPKNPQIVYAVLDNNFHKPDTGKKTVDTLVYQLRDFEKITKEEFSRLDPKRLDSFLKKNRMYPRYTAQMVMERVANGALKPSAIYDLLYDPNAAMTSSSIIGCEVYRSENGGQTWKKTNIKDLPSLYNTYGYYFGKVYVSPNNDQKIVVTGYEIYESMDGGKTFFRMDKENVHADHHACWIDPNRDSHMIIGNDGGCNITYDDGAHWFKANTPAVGQFYSVFADNAQPYNVYGGLQDNGVWYGPSTNKDNYDWYDNGNYPFKSIMGADGMQVQVDTRNNTTVYTGFQYGNYYRLDRTNPGRSAKRITPLSQLGDRPLRFNWCTPVLISSHNQDVVYIAGNKLFRSFNRADTFMAISNDLTKGPKQGDVPFATITTITESPLRFGLLYVGTDDGNIQISKDGGATWTLLNNTGTGKKQGSILPQGLWVSRIVASHYHEGRVYLTLNGYRNDDFQAYVFVSEDYGNTWTSISKQLPMEPVNVIREDAKNEDILYVGTDGGLYVSFNRGQSYMLWNEGLPRSIPIHDIAIQERDNEIILGTHGRSLYVAKLDAVQGLQKDKDWLKKHPQKDKAEDSKQAKKEVPGEED